MLRARPCFAGDLDGSRGWLAIAAVERRDDVLILLLLYDADGRGEKATCVCV